MPASKTDTVIDPIALWLDGVDPTEAPLPLEANLELPTDVAVPDSPAPLAGRFCTHCGEKATAVANFCAICGNSLNGGEQVGQSFAAAQGSSVTTESTALNDYRPKPAEMLSPAEKAERERQHAAALQAGRADPPLRFQPSQSAEKILIHFVEDGLTFAGLVWMRGQEIEIGPGDPRWEESTRWILQDDFQQMERYGKIMFRKGPWPGRRSYADGAGGFETVFIGRGDDAKPYRGPGEEELRKADQLEQQRHRGVPAPTYL